MSKEELQSEPAKVTIDAVDEASIFDDVALVDPKGSAISAMKEMFKSAQLLGFDRNDSETFTDQFFANLHEETREKLLKEFIEKEVVKAKAARRRTVEHMDDLAADADQGAYNHIFLKYPSTPAERIFCSCNSLNPLDKIYRL